MKNSCPGWIKLSKKSFSAFKADVLDVTCQTDFSAPSWHQLQMNNEELLTWIHLVIDKFNNQTLILGAPLGITLTPIHVLLGFQECYGDKINKLHNVFAD